MAGRIDARLAELGITLPTPMPPIANYVPFVVTGNLVVVSGQVPAVDGKIAVTGKVGPGGLSIEQGQAAARQCFINVLTQLRADARQQHGEAERLDHIIVRAGLEAEDGIAVRIVPGQHDDRRLEAALAQDAHGFAAVDIRQADIHQHQIDLVALGGLHALGAVFGGDGVELVMQRQLLDQRFAQFGIVIDNQNGPLAGHCVAVSSRVTNVIISALDGIGNS